MGNIKIIKGPKNFFLENIPVEENYITLSEATHELDRRDKDVNVRVADGKESIEAIDDFITAENLVTFSSDYFSVAEHTLENFIMILNRIKCNALYLHNPPLLLENAIKSTFNENIIDNINFNYPTVDTELLKTFYFDFENKIIGQSEAKISFSSALYKQTKTTTKNLPIVLLLYGESGVGKTETAKFLSELLGGEIFRVQFSMAQNESYSKYIYGSEINKNCFASELLNRNSNILLFDEFDKAHYSFYSAFYQMFDEGIFTDKNYSVNLENSIIICTSNYKSEVEVEKHLGTPIFSRFNSFIKYNEITFQNKIKIAEKIFDKILSSLDKDDFDKLQSVPKFDKFKEIIIIESSKLKNVRLMKNYINQFINTILLYIVLYDKKSINLQELINFI